MSDYQIRPNCMAVGEKDDELSALAVSSGIAVCLYDELHRVGGMTYTLFPDSGGDPEGGGRNKLKYVDTSLDELLSRLLERGASCEGMSAKIVGGAKIFHFSGNFGDGNLGRRNVEAAREWLKKKNIPIRAEDTGDNFGRTVRFRLADGKVEIESVSKYQYCI